MSDLPSPGHGPHVADDVPLLLAGEADRDTVRRVGAHLRACSDCRDDLVEAVVSHATLRSAAFFAPDVATAGRLPVGERVPRLLDDAALLTEEGDAVDLGPVFAQIRAEAAAGAPEVDTDTAVVPATDAPVDELAARRRGRRLRYGLVAAAAVIVVGGGSVAAVETFSDRGRGVTVAAYGSGTVDAHARVGDGWVELDASDLPNLPSDKYYEAWLVNPSATGLLSLGPLGADGTASYRVPPAVMAQYPTLQVTVQENNGNPAPSDVSVLRASL